MRTEIKSFEDLSDSREMMKAKEPNLILIFISLIFIIFTAAIIWMWFGEIDITVRALGVLRPKASVSVVRNINGGEIKKLNYHEGKKVQEGDLLYQIDSKSIEIQLATLTTERNKVIKDLENLKIFEKSINKEENLFKIENIKYYNRYLSYKYQLEQLALEYNQAEKRYQREQKLDSYSTTPIKLEELNTAYNLARVNYLNYQSEILIAISSEIEKNENTLLQLESQIQNLESKIELNNVRAPINGVIQSHHEFNQSDYMPTGIEVLRIIPDKDREYRMEIMVENKDIIHLKLGQEIRYRFHALPYREYGVLKGAILRISKDALEHEETNMSYRVEASINEIKLYDRNDRIVQVKPGMIAESRVVIKQKKILYYVLEKLDFLS